MILSSWSSKFQVSYYTFLFHITIILFENEKKKFWIIKLDCAWCQCENGYIHNYNTIILSIGEWNTSFYRSIYDYFNFISQICTSYVNFLFTIFRMVVFLRIWTFREYISRVHIYSSSSRKDQGKYLFILVYFFCLTFFFSPCIFALNIFVGEEKEINNIKPNYHHPIF